jgi:cytochrome d ubiquinol oxidase subunit I
MVGLGTAMALLGVVFLVIRVRKKRLPESPWFYRAVALAGPAAFVALIAGWTTTEVGRQPWVVYRVMRTEEAVTNAGGIPVGYATLFLVYVLVAIGVAWVLRRLAAAPDPGGSGPPRPPSEAEV